MIALRCSDFSQLENLFLADLLSVSAKTVTKRYYALSARFHPDKNKKEEELFKVAFQALNEAHEVAKAF